MTFDNSFPENPLKDPSLKLEVARQGYFLLSLKILRFSLRFCGLLV
jgi:hypothetical protein